MGGGRGSENAGDNEGLRAREPSLAPSPPFFSRVLAPLPLPRLRLPRRLTKLKQTYMSFDHNVQQDIFTIT